MGGTRRGRRLIVAAVLLGSGLAFAAEPQSHANHTYNGNIHWCGTGPRRVEVRDQTGNANYATSIQNAVNAWNRGLIDTRIQLVFNGQGANLCPNGNGRIVVTIAGHNEHHVGQAFFENNMHFVGDQVVHLENPSTNSTRRDSLVCEEVGHALGLQHAGNGCMQDVQFTATAPDQHDYDMVNALHDHVHGGPPPPAPLGPPNCSGSRCARPAIQRGNLYYLRGTMTTGGHNIGPYAFGIATDVGLFCDWDGNGSKTIGVWRRSNLSWYITNNNTSQDLLTPTFAFGDPTDIPICGDWDGNGTETVGMYRPSQAGWYLSNYNNLLANYLRTFFTWGNAYQDRPVVGDWNGDGRDNPGIFRPSDPQGARWYFNNSNTNSTAFAVNFGDPADANPIVGDWDGDGDTTVGLRRNFTWLMQDELFESVAAWSIDFGDANDRPLVW